MGLTVSSAFRYTELGGLLRLNLLTGFLFETLTFLGSLFGATDLRLRLVLVLFTVVSSVVDSLIFNEQVLSVGLGLGAFSNCGLSVSQSVYYTPISI